MGDADRELTEQRVRRIYDLWAHGEIDEMIADMAADVKLVSTGGWAGAPAPVTGRNAFAAHLRQSGAKVENIISVLHEIVIDGDRVVVHRTAVGRLRANDRRYQCDFIDFFRFRDGLVVEFSEYSDPAWIEAEARA